MKEIIYSKSYTLRDENDCWLGQIVLTSDGMFASVTDYGNLSCSFRAFGKGDFTSFLLSLDVEYFGKKLYQSNTYLLYSQKFEKSCKLYAEKILPQLQKLLKEELENNFSWQ